MLLVNLFPPFARACGVVPVLRELAQAVAWSPSLSAAVENDYVQPIGQSQTVNGVTATVEYVIVDRKQVNIFYTLDYAPDLGPMWADCRITPGDGSAGDAGGRTEKPGELVEIKRDFVDRDVPGILDLTLSVYPAEQDGGGPPAENTGDGYFDQPVDDQPAYLAEMTFHLEFDPYFTAQGTLLELNRTFALDGQTFTLQEAEIYPTHLRLTLTADPDNTAWLAGLDLYLENEHGERFEKSLSGITAIRGPGGGGHGHLLAGQPLLQPGGAPDPPHHRRPAGRTRTRRRCKLNLAEGTAENLPEGVTWFQGAERLAEGWIVYLMSPLMENRTMGSVFSRGAWDEDGNYYDDLAVRLLRRLLGRDGQERVGEDRWYTEDFPRARGWRATWPIWTPATTGWRPLMRRFPSSGEGSHPRSARRESSRRQGGCFARERPG